MTPEQIILLLKIAADAYTILMEHGVSRENIDIAITQELDRKSKLLALLPK